MVDRGGAGKEQGNKSNGGDDLRHSIMQAVGRWFSLRIDRFLSIQG
jgi:hypothetical protein